MKLEIGGRGREERRKKRKRWRWKGKQANITVATAALPAENRKGVTFCKAPVNIAFLWTKTLMRTEGGVSPLPFS